MKAKELAQKFNMRVGNLSEYVGYSRQGLYEVLRHGKNIDKARFKAMLIILQDLSNEQFKEDTEKALLAKEIRETAIKELEKRLECAE